MTLLLPRKAPAILLALAFAWTALSASAASRRVQRRVTPQYPELARRMHVEGAVRVEATVAPDGDVTSAKALNGNTLLQSAAVQAIRRWKFAAESARSTENVVVNFRLDD